MTDLHFDIAIIGSGFAGGLTAWLARRLGLSVIVIDKGAHPRFAIGESSTPVTNLILEQLGARFDLPELAALGNYGTWKERHPTLDCGLKRGFSYFHHVAGQPFQPCDDHRNELLVAASHGAHDADTHWLRADFDHYLITQAERAGAVHWDGTTLTHLEKLSEPDPTYWKLTGERDGSPFQVTAEFLVDGTGDGGWLPRQLGLTNQTHTLHTHSRTVFAHFRHVGRWQPLYEAAGGCSADHPYPCDDAALHHVFDGGWMWVLRFDSGLTSAGFCLDPRVHPPLTTLSPTEEWNHWLARFPSIHAQFRDAVPVSDGGQLRRLDRIQRLITPAAGPQWALLPAAAGLIDPLHSTGNAQTLCGIERLIGLWERHWGDAPALTAGLARYSTQLELEIRHVDRIVAGSYAGFAHFPRMVAISMFYFAAAIHSEHLRRTGVTPLPAFVLADDARMAKALADCQPLVNQPHISNDALLSRILSAIEPINVANLGNPARRNLYPYPV